MRFDVVTFGSAVVDVFVYTDVAEKGKFMMYPVGSKMLIKKLIFNIGGGGTNTAVAFCRLGLKTGYIGKLGNDENGDKVLSLLEDEKIEFLGKKDKSEQTGYSVILDSKEHDRTILTYKGANDNIHFNEIKKFETKWLYYSSLLEESFKSQEKLAKILVPRGVKLAFNPSEYLIKNKDLKPLLKLCEVLILNKEEAGMLTKEKDLLVGLRALGPKIVLITNKDEKVECYDGVRRYSIMPHKIKVHERTGAGDAFASGFVAGLAAGKDINYSLKLGLEEGESVIKHAGAKKGLLRKKIT